MFMAGLGRRYLGAMVSLWCTAGVVLGGCAPPAPPPLTAPSAAISEPLAALQACITRSQRGVQAAAEAGMSAAPLAPIHSGIADAQDAMEEGTRLAQQGKPQEAAARLAAALAECDTLDAMLAKARQDAAERRVRVQMMSEAEARLASTATCIDRAQQAFRQASTPAARNTEVMAAKGALERAETGLRQAREALAHNDPKSALERLHAAMAACEMARDTSEQVVAQRQSAPPTGRPRRSR